MLLMQQNERRYEIFCFQSIDKSKIEQVSRMVQNMSSDDLANLVGMLSKNQNNTQK